LIPGRTAVERRQAVMDHLDQPTVVVKAAAVADYHRTNPPQQKVKKTAARFSLELDPTPDILAELGRKKGDRLLVGFAAETENLAQEARRKLASKNCDMIVGNLAGEELPFHSDQNELTLALPTGDALLKIVEEMGCCTRCRLHQGRNKIVLGVGSEQAKLVFVGEGPGADEDAQGIPFVGRAGQLLTQMIENTSKKEGIPLLRND